MATTHALVGVVLAAVTTMVAPELTPVALPAAVAGSVFPDFDLYSGHRRTLHYPTYYSAFALPVVALAVVAPSVPAIALAFFLTGAAVHSVMDIFGGGLELKPWQAASERAVYDHFQGRWVPPKRWIRYDGAPEDLLVAIALASPALVLYDQPVTLFVGAVLAVSAAYTFLRKPLAVLVERLVPALPVGMQTRLPDRFRDASK
nr:metal-dependent hydrolase [Halorussus halophilus]